MRRACVRPGASRLPSPPASVVLSTVVGTLLGMAMIAVVLRDLLHTLLHPIGRGSLSRWILRSGWRVFHGISRGRADRLTLAGPVLLVAVIAVWFALLVTGWALIYMPHMPGGFSEPDDFTWRQSSGIRTALYYSMVTLSTVGYGDFTATTDWLRFASGLQAVVGFVLLTASITWVLSVYPVLTRQRSLAHTVSLVRQTARDTGSDPLGLGEGESLALLRSLTSQLVLAESDLAHFTIAYYFAEREHRASLSATMPYLMELAQRAGEEAHPAPVRFQAALLSRAVDDFAAPLHRNFLPHVDPPTTQRVRAEYARDHEPRGAGRSS